MTVNVALVKISSNDSDKEINRVQINYFTTSQTRWQSTSVYLIWSLKTGFWRLNNVSCKLILTMHGHRTKRNPIEVLLKILAVAIAVAEATTAISCEAANYCCYLQQWRMLLLWKATAALAALLVHSREERREEEEQGYWWCGERKRERIKVSILVWRAGIRLDIGWKAKIYFTTRNLILYFWYHILK